jgi:hypothetical protein
VRFHKKRAGTHDEELVFLYLVVSVGHVVHPSASGARNVDAFHARVARYGFHKKYVRACCIEPFFLHSTRSTDHVVHSSASRAQKVDALC